LKLYIIIRKAVSETVSKSTKVIVLTFALAVIALIQASSTIVGSFASYERPLYLISYCMDKFVGMTFLVVCLLGFGPIVDLLNYVNKKIKRQKKKEGEKEEELQEV
jgi:hypothetical protein